MNSFYPVLNEVHDKAAKELPLAELALFEHIWRKLIGWGKFEDEISISQLVNETRACKSSIIHILKQLEKKRWIIVTRQVSVVNRKFTNKIAIPACPGIESRLGWSKIHTTPGTESTLGGSVESRHTIDSSSKDNLKTIPPTPQIDVTTSMEPETKEAGGDSDSKDDLRMIQKATKIQELITMKWGKQLSTPPDIEACKNLLRQFNWDHKILVCAITEGPEVLDYPNSVMKLVGKIAERIEIKNGGIVIESLTEEQKMVESLKYCAKFPHSRMSEIYPLLELLAAEIDKPILEVYAMNDYLSGSLESYKEAMEVMK